MSHIRVKKMYYSLKSQRLYFMDSTEENAILGKTILVVVLRLVHRGFGSQDPRMRLPFGSPGARLLEEMLTDQHHPMKYAKLDRLTAYVAARLYSESREHVPSPSGGSSASPRDDREDYTRQARDVTSSVKAQPSPGKFEPDSGQSQRFTSDTTEEASQAASVSSRNDFGSAKTVRHTGGKEGAQAFQDRAPQGTTPGEQTNFANLSLEDLQVVLQQESSICWLVPACPVRKRFVGPGASYLKAIRDIARVPVIFWKNVGQSEDWFLFIIASHARLATAKERQNLAHAFRLCKAWAIAVNAEDCFPVARDIPNLYRDDADFRLNEFELSAALDKAARLKSTVQGQDFLRLASGVLHELGRELDRSHNDVGSPLALQNRINWRACHVGELCTTKNSICWTVTNNRGIHTLIGERSCHLFTIERITGIKALKVDINKFRYGAYGCGIHILAYKPLAYNPSDKTRLSRAFRLMVFIMKVFGYDTLVPKQDSLIVDESYVTELFDACQLDEKQLPSIAPVLHEKGLSERLIRAVFSQLFAADGTVQESDSQLCVSGRLALLLVLLLMDSS